MVSKRSLASVKARKESNEPEEFAANGCPIATQDVSVNLRNRQVAIDKANYGPMVPSEANTKFWQQKADIFGVSPAEAKLARCRNCAAFIQTKDMINCIISGLDSEPIEHAADTVKAANLGFCNIFDFKCAGDRTCDAWVTNGPIK
jgi:hypothetical protein